MENSAHPQILSCDIQTNIYYPQIPLYVHIDILPLNMQVTLAFTFQVKCDGTIGLPIYRVILMFNSNI